MVKLTTSILSVAFMSTSTLVNAMVTNCEGSYWCGHAVHQRCDDRTIEHFRHLFHAEVQDGNGEMWYPSGGPHIACLAGLKHGSCCVRWNGKMANGTISEALHYTDVLLQAGCLACGSTLLDPTRPGELTVNFVKRKHPECDGKLCPGGIKGKRPKPTWMGIPPKTLETKTRAPEEQSYAESVASKSKSQVMLENAAASIQSAASASIAASIADAADSAVSSQLDEEKSESSAAMAASASKEQATSKSDTPSDNGDVTVTEKETKTQTVEPPKTVTKKETATVKVTRGRGSGAAPTETPSMTTIILKSDLSPKDSASSESSTEDQDDTETKSSSSSGPATSTSMVISTTWAKTIVTVVAGAPLTASSPPLAGIPPSIF